MRILWILLLVSGLFLVTVAETRVLISFDSKEGHTEKVATWIAEGCRSQDDVTLRFKRTAETTHEDLFWADAIIVGSPVYNTGLTPAVGTFLAEWPFNGSPLKNKVGSAFVSSQGAAAGSEGSLFRILKTMMMFRMIVVGGNEWRSGFGVAYIVDTTNEKNISFVKKQAYELGARCCEIARETSELR